MTTIMEVPQKINYDHIEYTFYKKIKENMYMYKSRAGFKICFDEYQLRPKDVEYPVKRVVTPHRKKF